MKIVRFLIIVIVAIAIGSLLSRFVLNIDGETVQFRSFIPNIVLSAESLNGLDGRSGWLTNTLFTTFIVDAIIIVLALLVRAGIRTDGSKPGNALAHAWEWLVDVLYRNHMVPTLGTRAKVVAPIAISAFVFIVIAALLDLIPGAGSIGRVEVPPSNQKGWCAAQSGGVTLITGVPVDPAKGYAASCGRQTLASVGTGDATQTGYAIVPFLRRPTSSLSTTIALSLVAFVFIQIQGVRANGIHYFARFIQIKTPEQDRQPRRVRFKININIMIGVLGIISELIRILSLAFRLFGSMFVGTALVLAMSSILPTFLPTAFMALEFGVGILQAFVFLMLITVFTSLATAYDWP